MQKTETAQQRLNKCKDFRAKRVPETTYFQAGYKIYGPYSGPALWFDTKEQAADAAELMQKVAEFFENHPHYFEPYIKEA